MSQADELDDRIALCFVLEIADLSGVYFSSSTSEIGYMPRTYHAEVEGVSEMRSRVELLRQILNNKVKEERVGIGV